MPKHQFSKGQSMSSSHIRRKLSTLLVTLALLTGMRLFAQQPVQRPKITGISHVGYFVSDLPKTIAFWHDFLGFDESYTLTKRDSTDIRIAFIKINDHPHI